MPRSVIHMKTSMGLWLRILSVEEFKGYSTGVILGSHRKLLHCGTQSLPPVAPTSSIEWNWKASPCGFNVEGFHRF